MNGLKITILILSLLVLMTQGARHIYVRYIEPRISALDQFEDSDAKKVIRSAKSLSEIMSEYEPARRRVDELNKELKTQLSEQTRDEYYMYEQKWREDHREEYKREEELKSAVKDWENRSKEILELRVFWSFGFSFFLLGAFLISRERGWIGLAMIIPGIVEMVWWTSPSFRFVGSPLEFDRLLNNKLGFTIATILVLVVAWILDRSKEHQDLPRGAAGYRRQSASPDR